MSDASKVPAGYLHGYGTPEQEGLIEQAEHRRETLILDGTTLQPGTRLLEVGCGVGAVLAVLGPSFPGLQISGVDIEPRQLAFARGRLARAGVQADLRVGDAVALPLRRRHLRSDLDDVVLSEEGVLGVRKGNLLQAGEVAFGDGLSGVGVLV